MRAPSGAEAFAASLVAAGARHVFGNPGSTETAFLEAVSARPELTYVTCLHEGVAVGAAEGLARAAGSPAVVQLHTAGGLGNALGMLGNAAAGGTPLVVMVGGAARATAYTEPALGGDLIALAAPTAKWAWELRSADEVPTVVARAFKVAAARPAGPVVIAAPIDVMDEPCTAPVLAPSWVERRTRPDDRTLRAIVVRLLAAAAPALVVGDGVAVSGAGEAAAELAHALGAPIYASALHEAVLPPGEPLDAGALPLFDADGAARALAAHDLVVVVGGPVVRSAFPRGGPPLGAGANVVHVGADPWELGKTQPALAALGDERSTLEALLGMLAAHGGASRAERAERARVVAARLQAERPPLPPPAIGGPLTADCALAAIASALPDGVALVDESVSAAPLVGLHLPRVPRRWFGSRGGALGAGMSLALGVAVADRSRPVVALVGDGAAMYTSQALWTAARNGLPIVFVVLDNGGYRILEANARRRHPPGAAPASLPGTSLGDPSIDFAGLGTALGVEGWRVERAADVAPALAEALRVAPSLIHIVLAAEPPGR